MGKRIVVVGSNFAGYTAALELKKHLKDEHDIVVLSKWADFVFMPSLIWLPFGKRKRADVTFPLKPVFDERGITFVQTTVTQLDLDNRRVVHAAGEERYDYLVLATGPVNNWAAVPGLGPYEGHTQSIFGIDDAERAAVAFEKFLTAPGPVVVGAVQGASCFGAAYEFLFNFSYQMKKHHLKDKVQLTYLTPEPYLAHFGLGGFGNGTKMTEMFFKHENITAVTNAAVKEVRPGEIVLTDGRTLPFAFSMLAPSFLGAAVIRESKGIANAGGFVEVNDYYQTAKYPEVYAAGVAVAIKPPDQTAVPCGVPKTGYLSEEMAKVVVHNIVADVHGAPKVGLPPAAIDAKCVLDAGNNGIIMLADHFLEPREHAWLVPGPEAHWAKLAFEKYFLSTHRRGWT
jgi:sulfide:quinone oxidoreductase